MTQVTFSVIIASYNAAATIAQAIDSILAQSYSAHEIIVIDDGSNDDTAAVVGAYGDKVRYHRQDNAGVSAARNKGAELASGEWLAFLDADDWYYANRLAGHAALLAQQPDSDFLIGDYHYGRADGSVIRRSIELTLFGMQTLAKANAQYSVFFDVADVGALIPAYFGHTLTFSLPRATFLEVGGYDRRFSVGEDLHLLIRLAARFQKAAAICQPMGVYCIHDDGLMRRDVVKAQLQTVATLSSLRETLKTAPAAIQHGFLLTLVNARFDLATALLRTGQHKQALVAFLPAVTALPSWRSLRLLLSLMKG